MDLTALHLSFIGTDALFGVANQAHFAVHVSGGTLEIDEGSEGSADAVFDLKGVCSIDPLTDLLFFETT